LALAYEISNLFLDGRTIIEDLDKVASGQVGGTVDKLWQPLP